MDIFECIWEDGLTGLELKRVCWIWLAWINQIHTIKLFIIWYKYKIQFSTRKEPNCIIRDSNRIVRGSIEIYRSSIYNRSEAPSRLFCDRIRYRRKLEDSNRSFWPVQSRRSRPMASRVGSCRTRIWLVTGFDMGLFRFKS